MSNFTDEQVNEFKDLFTLFDRSGEEKIAFHDVGEAMRAFGYTPTNEEVHKILDSPSKDEMKSRFVTFNEFLPMLAQVGKVKRSGYDQFIDGLKMFDKEGNGTLLGAEMRHVLCSMGEKLTEEEAEMVMAGQEDGNGFINYESFVDSIVNKNYWFVIFF